jgi:hypothetical protein
MEADVHPEEPTRNSWLKNMKYALPAMVVFFAIIGFNIWRLTLDSVQEFQPNGMPISPEIEERFGVRFTGVYVVAKSGLIDLRYRVLDAGKAKNFGHYTETSPLLIADDTGKTSEVTIMMLHNHRVEGGRIYYILFRNTDNAFRAGSKLTIQVDDLRLENVIAQ